MGSGIRVILMVAALAIVLTACGFVTAPLKHGIARTVQAGVKGTEAGIEHGKEAAIVVAEKASSVTSAAIEGLKPATAGTAGQQNPGLHPSQRR